VLRPLLETGRAEVLAYLKERGLSYRVDSTNADPVFLRNRIRLKLIPCLDEFFPFWRKALAELAETQRLVADFLEAEAAARIPWEEAGGTGAEQRRLTGWDNFFSQPAILREEALFAVLDRFSGGAATRFKPPRRKSLRLFAQGKAGSLDLGRGILKSDTGSVALTLPRRANEGFLLLIKKPGIYKLKGLCIRAFSGKTGETANTPGFFARPPVALRRRYPEDFIIRDGRKHRGAEIAGGKGLIVAEDALGLAAFIAGGQDGSIAVFAGAAEERAQQENCLFCELFPRLG
jgi:tRNA(Ile)-lysidine synthase